MNVVPGDVATTLARPLRVLLADDEEPLRRILVRELQRRGHDVAQAADGAAALRLVADEDFDVAVLDVRMPGMDGLAVLRALQREPGGPEVVLLTGNATVETAVEAMKLGAYDFLTKPCKIEVLDALVRAAGKKREVARDNDRLRRREAHREAGPAALGWNSLAMQPVLRLIERLGPSDLPVLVLGESGVGKELVAREIHRRSRRARGPFVDLNCAAIPENLLESELFGHEKGAFTGAETARAGLMEAADGGTLFLDEVGELPAALQVKLLRVLETMMFFRVGGRKKVSVDVRLVAATNRDLGEEALAGRFRTDLYYRINAGMIPVPPLRERIEEIAPLTLGFLGALGPRVAIGADVLAAFQRYAWPGNVRELRNVIERAVLLAHDGVVRLADLPREIVAAGSDPGPGVVLAAGTAAVSYVADDDASAAARGVSGESEPASAVPRPGTAARAASARARSGSGSLEELERERILEVLEGCRWHRGHAAAILGISVRTLFRKIRSYGLDG